jgi:hypothetical protein
MEIWMGEPGESACAFVGAIANNDRENDQDNGNDRRTIYFYHSGKVRFLGIERQPRCGVPEQGYEGLMLTICRQG